MLQYAFPWYSKTLSYLYVEMTPDETLRVKLLKKRTKDL